MPNISRIKLPKDTLYVKGNILLASHIVYSTQSLSSNDMVCLSDCVVGSLTQDSNKTWKYEISGNLRILGKLTVLDRGRVKLKIKI